MQTTNPDAANPASPTGEEEAPFESKLEATAEQEEDYPPETKRLLTLLRERMPLYAVLDAARDPLILPLLNAAKEPFQSLYQGESAETLAEVAPYIVTLQKEAPLLRMLARFAWGRSWGVYLSASTSMEEARRHLRHFLMVDDPDGKEMYFRFYDPRVLRVYLPSCTTEELQTFVGPVKYLIESEDGGQLLEFSPAAKAKHELKPSDPQKKDA